MTAKWEGFKTLLSSLECKYYCVLIVFILSCSVGIIYWQYLLLINDLNYAIDRESAISKKEIDVSFSSYNALLRVASTKIVERNIANDPKAVSALLKQFYISSSGKSDARIHLLDINWQGNNTEQVNRYGTLAPIKLPKEVESHIRTFPKQSYLFNIPNNIRSNDSTMLFTMGLIDNNKTYIGRLSLIADFSFWIEGLKEKLIPIGLIAAMIDKDNNTLFASDSSDTTFTHNVELKPYNYQLAYGYNKQYFRQQLIKRSQTALIIFWGSVLALSILQIFYKRKLKANLHQFFNYSISSLTADNHNYVKENNAIKEKLLKQTKDNQKETRHLTDKIQAIQLSEGEKSKLEGLLITRITESLHELKEAARVLIHALEGSLANALSFDQQIKLICRIQNKLAYLSACCVTKETEDEIDFRALVDDSIKLFAKEIFMSSLSIKIDIPHDLKHLRFDELLFRQLFVNLLHKSVSCSRPKGTVKISAGVKLINANEHLVITIKDDGFGVSGKYENQNTEEQKIETPLSLDTSVMQDLIKSFGGSLDVNYAIGHGTTQVFSLPYVEKKPELIEGSNVVLLRKN